MILNVEKGRLITAADQNALIAQVNANTTDIANLSIPGGDPAAVQALIDTSITVHTSDPTPHPAYDDLPSLRLLFENGLV